MTDFIKLAQEANEPNVSREESMERKGRLFRALFELESWLFAIDPNASTPTQPLIREWQGQRWVFGYTDSEKLETFVTQEDLQYQEKTLFLSMAPEQGREWFLSLQKIGVYGVHFNFGVGGWYIPLQQIEPIYRHLYGNK